MSGDLRQVESEDAYEVVMGGAGVCAVVLTCEHASGRLPAQWKWSESDRRLVGTHWNVDLGAADFTREFAETIGATAILSRFTRLLIDPNRDLESPTLFRQTAENELIELNRDVPPAEAERRIQGFYLPLHDALDRYIGGRVSANLVLSIHSFTPLYEGVPREVEVGVLFDHNEPLAQVICDHLVSVGYDARMNEPWSGLNGLMYSALRHATTYNKRSLEIEMRQDLSSDPEWRRTFGVHMRQALVNAGVFDS